MKPNRTSGYAENSTIQGGQYPQNQEEVRAGGYMCRRAPNISNGRGGFRRARHGGESSKRRES